MSSKFNRENIEKFLGKFLSLLPMAKIYTCQHQRFKANLQEAYELLIEILRDNEELSMGIVGQEVAYENEIFFDLSRNIKGVIWDLKNKGLERMTFYRGISQQEFSLFLDYLTKSAKESVNIDVYLRDNNISNISAGKIKTVEEEECLKEEIEKTTSPSYEDSLNKVSESFDFIFNKGEININELKLTVSQVMDNLLGRHQEFLKLAGIKQQDVGTFIHLLNVCILSMYFSSKLGFSKKDVLDIGVAALFHDIGKIYIARNILAKESRLSQEEFLAIKSHTLLGAKILLQYVDTLGVLPVIVAFEHHLGWDMKGYPKLVFVHRPHIISLIVSICDIYDALSSRRTYKRDYPPEVVYQIMNKTKGENYPSELLDKFFQIMGVWPLGTIVSLNDGSIAIVREANYQDIFSPKVEIISDPSKKGQIIDLSATKLNLSIKKSLNPLAEGKTYLGFI